MKDGYAQLFGLTGTESEIFRTFVTCRDEIQELLDDAAQVCREEPSVRSLPHAMQLREFFQVMVEAFSEADPQHQGKVALARAMAAYLTIGLHARIMGESKDGYCVSGAGTATGYERHE